MNFWQFLVDYGLTILSAIATVISLIFALIKARKSNNSKAMVQIFAKIPELVTQAETIFGNGNGQAKFNYVLTELRVFAIEKGITLDISETTQQIESVVATTKNVNVGVVTPTSNNQTTDVSNGNLVENGTNNNEIDINL